MPVKVLQRIDYERGDISRSRFIQRILERAYLKKDTATDKKITKNIGNDATINYHSTGVTHWGRTEYD